METEEPVSKKVITGIGLAYASVRRYLSSHAVPRRFLVLSNSARNFFWLQSFAKALRINWYSSPREILTVVSEVDDIRQDWNYLKEDVLGACIVFMRTLNSVGVSVLVFPGVLQSSTSTLDGGGGDVGGGLCSDGGVLCGGDSGWLGSTFGYKT
ncbi:hypothetical protein Tco_0291134 [Tanacetum coccineum]